MKRFFNILYFVSLSMLALGQSTQGDNFFFMDAGVNVITETSPQAPKIDTVVVIQRDTLVQYQEYAGNASQVPMLVRHAAYEQRLLGVKKYSYGEMQMDEKAFQKFLYENNTKIYADYMNSKRLIPAGWWLFGSGLVLALPVGLSTLVDDDLTVYMGSVCWAFGGAAFISSIPILCVGYRQKNRVTSLFNNHYNNSEIRLSLNLQASQNGIGLALNF